MSKIFIISGPSGTGKGSIIESLISNKELALKWVKTVTTRQPRLDDRKYGRHLFVEFEKFKKLIAENKFAEYNFYNGNYYGTLKKTVLDAIASENNSIMEIDINGSTSLKNQFPKDIVQIFVYADFDDIRRRLQKRGTADNLIEQRLMIAKEEMSKSIHFEYRINNKQNKLCETVESIKEIILKSGGEKE